MATTDVITFALVLFAGFESVVPELTLALLVIEPLAGAVTVSVTVDAAPMASAPTAQVTTPLLLAPPPVALANVTPPGRLSVTTTLLAEVGPPLLALME